MKRSIEEIDVLIREALGQADADLLDQFGEQSIPEMITEAFRGRHRLEMGAVTLVIMLFFGLTIFCAVRFVGATEIRQMLLWGAGVFIGFSSMAGFKLVGWMEMNRNALAREIKRLELQIAQLAKTLGNR
jgi:hypothetical protein